MARLRIIPSLLIDKKRLIKGKSFKNHKYVGDVLNAVKIFNEKEVDELVLLDIKRSISNEGPNMSSLKEIASEAFFPLAYGGGITKLSEIEKLMRLGIEKVILGSSAFINPELVSQASEAFGSQSIVISVDYKKTLFGKEKVFINNGTKNTSYTPLDYAKKMEDLGAGELILSSIQRDGNYQGYDLDLLSDIAKNISIPVVISGGANMPSDFIDAKIAGASGVAAGSMFIFYGAHKAVLINYPKYETIANLLKGAKDV